MASESPKPRLQPNPRPRRPKVDLRLVPIALGLWGSAAAVLLTVGGSESMWWVCVLACLGLSAVVAIFSMTFVKSIPMRRLALLGACGLATGAAMAGFRSASLEVQPLQQMSNQQAYVTFEAVIESPVVAKRVQSPTGAGSDSIRWSARGGLLAVSEAGRRWVMEQPVAMSGSVATPELLRALLPGSVIRGHAVLRRPPPARPLAALVAVRGPPTVLADAPWWQRGAASVRQALRQASSGLSPDPRGLLPGLVVGDEAELPDDLVTDMRLVGMSHLTAVSGANLAIVTGLVLLLARALGLPRWASVGLAAIALLGFIVVVGPQPSVLRAGVMGAIALLGLVTRRPRAGLSVLTASVVLLLLVDPWLAISAGFLLSVSATAGLLAWAARRSEQVIADGGLSPGAAAQRIRRWRALAIDVLGITVAAQLATAPIVAGLGSGVALVGVPANILATPAVPAATVLGLAAALVAVVAPGLGELVAQLAGYPTGWIALVARFAAQVPGGVVAWPTGLVGSLSLAAVMLVAGALALVWRRRGSSKLVAILAAAVVALGMVFGIKPVLPTSTWPPPDWIAVFCDVGQGDAIVIATGPSHAIVVDVGAEPKPIDACLTELGIDEVELLVLTHFHADHVGGLAGLLRHRDVARVIASPLPEPAGQFRRAIDLLASRGLSAQPARPGESGQAGGVSYRVLWPTRLIVGEGSAPNNSSVSLLVDSGDARLLLTGDTEPSAQEALMAAQAPVEADVVKIPHHGSRNQSPRLISWSGGQLAVASVGAHNTYGHPAAATLDAWRSAGASVARTDQAGDVAVIRDSSGTVALMTRRQTSP